MKLKKLKLNNFLSWEDGELDFSEDRKLLLDGQSGVGKSSLVEAILWNMYGQGRTDNRNLVKHGKKKLTVDLTLTEGNIEYLIRRTCTTTGTQTLSVTKTVDGKVIAVPADGLKETQAFIEREITGASWELFINSVASPQSNTESFVSATASQRKELLLEIIGAGRFDEWLEKCKAALADRRDKSSKLEGMLETLAPTIEPLKGEIEDLRKGDSIEKIRKDYKDSVKKVGEMQGEVKRISDFKIELLKESYVELRAEKEWDKAESDMIKMGIEDMGKLKERISKVNSTLERCEEYRKELPELENQERIYNEVKNSIMMMENSLPKDIPQLEEKVRSITDKLEVLDVEPIENCPTINAPCSKIVQIRENRKMELAMELGGVMKELNEKKEIYTNTVIAIKKMGIPTAPNVEKINAIRVVLDGHWRLMNESNSLNYFLETLETPKPNGKTRVLLSETEAKLAEAESRMDMSSNEMNRLFTSLQMAEDREKNIKSKEKTLKAAEDTMAKAEGELKVAREEMRKLELLKSALGPNGLKTVILDAFIPQLEGRINAILAELSDFRIEISTQAAKADGSGTKEGLYLTVINDQGERQDYGNYSGGEKVKVAVAISEGLAESQKVEFRILDEVFQALDSQSTEKFGEVLLKLQARFPQVIAVSHLPEIKALFEDKVTVVKKGGTSKIS